MDKKKQKNKKVTMDGLANLMREGFKKTQDQMAKNQEDIAIMVNTAVQGTQDLLVERIDQLDRKFEGKFEEVDKKFEGINYKLDKIDKKLDSQEKTIFNHDQ